MSDDATASSTALRLEGRDVVDLLHRIGTQALLDLAPGAARATLFCDFRGRLLHRAVVAMTSDRAVWLLQDDAPPGPLASYLDRNVFRDDVRIADRSLEWTVHAVPGGVGLAAHTLRERDGVPIEVALEPEFGLRLGGPRESGGAAPERERVRAGRPAHGHEITDEFNPYEVGLAHDVHLDKGCYTGQEVLLRLVTHRGVRRGLTRVVGAGEPPATPQDLLLDGRGVGRLTTAVPDGEGWIGLAVLRTDAVTDGVRLVSASGAPLTATTLLPAPAPLGRP